MWCFMAEFEEWSRVRLWFWWIFRWRQFYAAGDLEELWRGRLEVGLVREAN
jgi:hypothetical protein